MLFISILIMIVFSSLGKNEIFRNKLINRLGLIIILYVMLIHLNINSIEKISTGINIYNSLLLINNLNNVIILLVLLISLIYVMFISFNITSISKIDNINYSRNGLIILILFNIMGLTLLPLVNDIMILFIIIELQSYSLYLITSVFNESNNAIKSGLYYFIVGSIASFIILDATVSIYDDIGLTNIQYILLYINKINTYDLLALIIGLFIKIGLFPFYNYSISIYTLSPTIITNYISLMPKLSILTLILILINYINIVNNYDINIIINFFIVSSMIIGSIGGLNSIKIKTLLAYSSLLNVSYMLLAIISNNNESIVAYLFYIIQYSLTHMNIFAILLIVSIYSSILLNNNNNDNNNNKLNIIMTSQYSPIEYISQLKDLFINNIYLGLAFIISIYSLIGLPPLAGFYAKLLILVSTLNNGYIFLSLMLIIASSISTLYYANIIKIISFDTLQNFKNKSISNTWYTYNLFNKDLLNIDILYNTITNKIYYSNKNNKNNGEVSNIISYIVSSLTLIIMLVIIQYDTIIRGTYLVILYNSWI